MTAVNYYDPLLQEDLNTGTGTGTKRNPGGGQLTGTQVGVHTFAVGQQKVAVTWAPPSLAALGSTTTTVTVFGAAVGDFVSVSFSLPLSGGMLFAEVTAVNTVTVRLFNSTAAALALASGTLSVLVSKSR